MAGAVNNIEYGIANAADDMNYAFMKDNNPTRSH